MRFRRFNLNYLLILSLLLMPGVPAAVRAGENPDEASLLVSYAQDLYRKNGVNMPRSAFELVQFDNGQRVFYIDLISRNSMLSDDLVEAFLVGGAVSQHAREPMDLITLHVEVEFSAGKNLLLQASGDCCEKLYNRQISVEAFTDICLRVH